MSLSRKIFKIISDACVYFTAVQFLLLLAATGYGEMAPAEGGGVGKYLSLSSAALIFLACLIVSAMNPILRLDGYSLSVRLVLHFLGTFAAYAILFIVIPGAWTQLPVLLVRLGVFVILYLVIAFVVLIIRSIKKNRNTEELEYEAQFGEFFGKKK